MDENNYYELLGVAKDATQDEIKSAYRDLAKRYHPDVNPAKNAAIMFRLLHTAYETLSDPKARSAYDAPPAQEPSRESARRPSSAQEPYTYESNAAKPHKERRSDFLMNGLSFAEMRQSKFVLLESALIAFLLFLTLHLYFAPHIAISITAGCAVGFLVFLCFHMRVGVWVVSICCSLFWGWFAADIAYSYSQHDMKATLIWGIGALLLATGFHIKEASEL